MSLFRGTALVSVLALAACYNDAPPQSTFPEPLYTAGPPGGAADPSPGYQPYPGDSAYGAAVAPAPNRAAAMPAPGDAPAAIANGAARSDSDADDDGDGDGDELEAIAGSPVDPAAGAMGALPGLSDPADPTDPADSADPADPSEPVASAGPVDPTSSVTDAEIDVTLEGYGQWIDTDDYGQIWRPDATAVGVDFTPYESGGSWQYSDAGWAFAADYPWGWLPFHYGRWAWFHDYWGWVPGHRWGAAWVDWRHGGGVVGWRPRPPRHHDPRAGGPNPRDHRHGGGGTLVRDHRSPQLHDAHWRFATDTDFARPHVRSHLYGNLAEGLRVTSKVPAPPLRARATIHAPDLMRNRFTAGRSGGALVRDHRSGPGWSDQRPAVGVQRYPGRSESPSRGYDAPVRGSQPPRAYQQPPARADQRGFQQPPTRGDQRGFQQPARGYPQQPPRGYPQPPRGYPQPPRGYPQQPPRGYQQQPPRGYQPPRGSYQPPPRSYRPPAPSAPPSHSSSPPAHGGGSSSGSHSVNSNGSSHSNSGHHR